MVTIINTTHYSYKTTTHTFRHCNTHTHTFMQTQLCGTGHGNDHGFRGIVCWPWQEESCVIGERGTMMSLYMLHGYDTRNAENIDLYIPRCAEEIYRSFFLYKGSSSWNKLSPWVKESTPLNDFKHNYRLLNSWILPNEKNKQSLFRLWPSVAVVWIGYIQNIW